MSFGIFDVIIALCGAYLIFAGIQMKVKGTINDKIALARSATADSIRDKKGFVEYIWIRIVICGVCCLCAGVANLIISTLDLNPYIELGINAFFFVVLIVYSVLIGKAQKKFS